jgi:hypothetical protein
MSAESPLLASSSDIIPSNRKLLWIVGILMLAALILGTKTVARAISIAQSTWLYSDVGHAIVVAVTLVPAMLTCCLFLTAAWLLFSGRNPISRKPNVLASTVLFTAVYGPFCWAIVTSWWILMPVLPGFVAGVFTKPMDNKVLFVIACGLDTALILVSLLVVCGRLRRGLLLSIATALAISSLTSYAFYSHMHA